MYAILCNHNNIFLIVLQVKELRFPNLSIVAQTVSEQYSFMLCFAWP